MEQPSVCMCGQNKCYSVFLEVGDRGQSQAEEIRDPWQFLKHNDSLLLSHLHTEDVGLLSWPSVTPSGLRQSGQLSWVLEGVRATRRR